MYTRNEVTAAEAAEKLVYIGITQQDTAQFTEPNAQILDEIFLSIQHTSLNKKEQATSKRSGEKNSTEG